MDREYIKQLAGFVESSEDAIIRKTLDGTISGWNKGSEKMFGYTSKEMIGKNISLIIPTEFIKDGDDILKTLPSNEFVDRYETVRVKKNGELLNVSLIVSDLKDSAGNITGFYQVARDITSRKKSEAELLVANRELAFQNAEKEKRAAELLIANTELAFQNAEKEKRAAELMIANTELAFQNAEKEKRAAELVVANNELAFLNNNQQALFAAIVNSSYEAMLSKNLAGDITSWNYGAEKIFGYGADEIIGKNILTLIPPQLQYEEVDLTKKILKGETIDHYETERIRKDGTVFNALLTISPVKNFNGDIIGASKILRNITEEKKAALKLAAIGKEIADYKLALDKSGIVAVTDQKGIIKYVNDNFVAISKYSREELIGRDHSIINSGYHSKSFIRNLWVTIANGKIWKGEMKNKAKDGTIYWVDTTIVPFLDKDGKPYQYIAIRADITERKKGEEENKRLTERLQLATRSANLGIWDWNLENNTLFWDEQMCKLYNMDTKEFNALYEGWILRLHKEDRQRVDNEIQLAITNNKDYDTEFRVVWRDASIHYVKATGIVERDDDGKAIRMIGTNWDVTLEKEKEQHLKLLESVITNTTDSVLITEAEPFDEPGHRILFVNEAFTKMTGYSFDEVIGKSPRMLQGPETDKVALKELSAAIRKWQPFETTIINYKKNGEAFWINFSLTPVANEQGWYTHWIGIEKDVTEQKLAELQLKELNANLQKQANELVLSNAELEQFAYVASHDLQEPLRMITSFLTQLEKKYGAVIDDKGKQYIHFAVDGARRMRQIILDLLEFSRVGKTADEKELLDLNELLNEIKMLLRHKIEESKAVITIDTLPVIHAHRAPMRQIFQNLISNAVKYSNKAIPVQIQVSVKALKDHWQFSVTDNGIGINKDYFEKIFIIFHRLHTKEEYSGTGIGLAVTKKIIETEGGKIWLT